MQKFKDKNRRLQRIVEHNLAAHWNAMPSSSVGASAMLGGKGPWRDIFGKALSCMRKYLVFVSIYTL